MALLGHGNIVAVRLNGRKSRDHAGAGTDRHTHQGRMARDAEWVPA
jgi:hypothetical protein